MKDYVLDMIRVSTHCYWVRFNRVVCLKRFIMFFTFNQLIENMHWVGEHKPRFNFSYPTNKRTWFNLARLLSSVHVMLVFWNVKFWNVSFRSIQSERRKDLKYVNKGLLIGSYNGSYLFLQFFVLFKKTSISLSHYEITIQVNETNHQYSKKYIKTVLST